MSSWGEDSIYGQARKEGGIVDMFIDNTIGEDKRQAKKLKKAREKKLNKKDKKNLFTNKQLRYCPRCGERLTSMNPK